MLVLRGNAQPHPPLWGLVLAGGDGKRLQGYIETPAVRIYQNNMLTSSAGAQCLSTPSSAPKG